MRLSNRAFVNQSTSPIDRVTGIIGSIFINLKNKNLAFISLLTLLGTSEQA